MHNFNPMEDDSNKRTALQAEMDLNTDFKRQKISVTIDPSDFMCPITKQIFLKPVICDDGYTYEEDAIEGILNTTKISPMNRKEITSHYVNKSMMENIDKFFAANPGFKKLQYEEPSKSCLSSMTKAMQYLDNKNFSEFCKYTEIPLNHESDRCTTIFVISRYCDNIGHFEKILENSIDLNVKDDSDYLPIYYISKYCRKDIILMALKKGAVFVDVCKDNRSIVPYVLINDKLGCYDMAEIILYLMTVNYDFESRDIESIVNKLGNDANIMKLFKRIDKMLPYIVFDFKFIQTRLQFGVTHENVQQFVNEFRNDVDKLIESNSSEKYFNDYILSNKKENMTKLEAEVRKCFTAIRANNALSKEEKIGMYRSIDDIFENKLKVHDIWIKNMHEHFQLIYDSRNEFVTDMINTQS